MLIFLAHGDIWLQDMFRDSWDGFLEKYDTPKRPMRESIKKNVAKMLSCQDPEGGFFYYECPECHDFCIVTHTCKSRFCPRCGKKYRDKVSASVSKKMLAVPHRQLVFTVPPDLRPMMREHRELLGELFAGVNEAMESIIRDKAPIKYKKEGRRLGFVCFLHTYGRQLNWHPHIHILYAERWMDKEGGMGKLDFIPFAKIKLAFMFIMCRRIRAFYKGRFGNGPEYASCCRLLKDVVDHHPNGFYFYGPKRDEETTITSVKAMANYIARYASHPAISERRIESYDAAEGRVTWFYDPHEDDGKDPKDPTLIGRVQVTEATEDFIKRLIIHIPDPGFQQIRYYGFYSNAWRAEPEGTGHLFEAAEIEEMVKKNRWENGIVEAFGYDPLLCSCGRRMEYVREKSNLEGFPIETKKVRISDGEKRRRAEEWNEFEGGGLDVEEFCSRDSYDEYVTVKCTRCGKEHDVEAEIFFEIFETSENDIPVMECPECGDGDAVPIQYFQEYVSRKKKTP